MKRLSAAELIDAVLDPDSFVCWDEPIDHAGQPESYRKELEAAALHAGTDESVISGCGLVHGRPVAIIVNEFRFLAGSIGLSAAGRIVAAVRRATALKLPILASAASGGTRMHEGTPAFVQMIEISRAIMDHRAAGLPYLVHLRHPTTGGVLASWGSLGQITIGQPGALIGFLGPKVYELLEGQPFPSDVQTAENLSSIGILDAVVATAELRSVVDTTLDLMLAPPRPSRLKRRAEYLGLHHDIWQSILTTRRDDRITVRDVLRATGGPSVRLRGTAEGERESAMIVALTRLDGVTCLLVGQDRTVQSSESPMGPGALREARRGMRLAEELRLPLVTVIDTPGAELSVKAEEGGMAGEIARCLGTLTTLTVPTVSVLLGQGCGGGALALLPADVVVATENAWLSPLPPEGASAIVFGDVEHAADMAAHQHMGVFGLRERGIVHQIVPELPHDTPADLAEAVTAEIASHLRDRLPVAPRPRIDARDQRLLEPHRIDHG